MVHILGVHIPDKKRAVIGLTRIYGGFIFLNLQIPPKTIIII